MTSTHSDHKMEELSHTHDKNASIEFVYAVFLKPQTKIYFTLYFSIKNDYRYFFATKIYFHNLIFNVFLEQIPLEY